MSEMNDDQSLLVSVYLDGEATPEERARVEGDPELLAQVESLGQVRTVLGATVDPVSLASREANLAAALDVFERMSEGERAGEATPADGVGAAAAAAVSTPVSSSDTGRNRRPNRFSQPWLLGAAAATVLLVGGAIVFRGITSTGNDDADLSAPAEETANSAGPANELEIVESAEADAVAGDETVPLPADEALDEAIVATEDDRGDGLFEEETATADFEASTDSPESGEAPAEPVAEEGDGPPPEIDLTPLNNTEDLADFATLSIQPISADATVPAFDDDFELDPGSCDERFNVQRRAGFASYQGVVVRVGIDLTNRVVYAYTEDCTEIARVALTAAQIGDS